ncbi:hypothetical protein Kisp01_24070 [Kineosporia sp. NBRC 101677]|nr:hypothetical protein Kisp01_24070 [Kineosporia sp. NBRC 101677]
MGGHPAVDLVNTVDRPDGHPPYDHLATYPELLDWSRRVGVLSQAETDALLGSVSPSAAQRAVQRVQELREVLIETFTAVTAGAPVGSWPQLQPYVVEAIEHAELHGHGLRWPAEAAQAMLWPLAHGAFVLLTADPADLERLKHCGACHWVFIDRSRNGSRRWCSMGDCGNAVKSRRYVERRAARRAQGRSG